MELFLRDQRKNWQNDLGRFRNDYVEHRKDINPSVFARYYDAAHADKLFEQVWRTIAEILVALIMVRFSPGLFIVEIPPERRNPARPRRFEMRHAGLKAAPVDDTVNPDAGRNA